MKTLLRSVYLTLFVILFGSAANAANTLALNPYFTFGVRGDGSIQPGDSLGTSPMTGYQVLISAPNTPAAWYINPTNSALNETNLDVRATGSTNGFNMRGITYDPTSGNVLLVDTHLGSAGSVGGGGTNSPFCAIYVLDATNGTIIGALNTNGIFQGPYTHVTVGAADDGVIYVCNQTTASQTTPLKIYRYPTANTNIADFTNAPTIAFSNTLGASIGTSGERLSQTLDVRGAGTNTQMIIGTSSANGTGTNIFLFDTTNGTNFVAHRISFPQVITTAQFNDGIAFGPSNTFFVKQVGKPLYYMAYDAAALATGTNQILGTVIAGLEEIGGTATGGRGKVWLYHIPDPTNHAPAVLASKTYVPNFQKTTAPMGYVRFGLGRLYAHASNNGFLVNSVDSTTLNAPTFTTDLPSQTRVSEANTAHFEVFAVVDVTNYQWYSNNVPISGANTYYYDIPNVNTNMNGTFKVVAFNAAGSSTSANSTLAVVSAANFFHPNLLWGAVAGTTNYLSSGTGQNERTIAYNGLSNQLIVVRGPAAFASLAIFVIDADTGHFLYTMKTNGITAVTGGQPQIVGVGVAADGAMYACNVNSAVSGDTQWKVYRWADTGSNTLPVVIYGTNSSAADGNPIDFWIGSDTKRFGDALAVRGSGTSTEIIIDPQNTTKYVAILSPTDGTMTNWQSFSYLLQNAFGSYGSEAYGTTIGRSISFGSGNTFWMKRYNGVAGAPLSQMGYTPGTFGLSSLQVANVSSELFTNGSAVVNSVLQVGAGINFPVVATAASATSPDTLDYYDMTVPSQAVILSRNNLPGGNAGNHQATANAISQVIFGQNQVTGSNYIFTLVANNGVAAFRLSGGALPAPKILTQPHNLRILTGSSGSLDAALDQNANIQWYKGTNPPVAVTGATQDSYSITNAQFSDEGDYFLIATNLNGGVTSAVVHVSVSTASDNFSLVKTWSTVPTNSYVSAGGGANTPTERAFAYNAPSNQLIVVGCVPASTAYTVSVVNATSGALLYQLNTAGVVHESSSEVAGSNPIDLVGAAASDDGNIYICAESPNASGGAAGDATKKWNLYRWTNSAPTTPPVLVFQGDPSGQPAGINLRWGDVMTARGSGAGTELFVNAFDGSFGAILKPTDATLNTFTNYIFGDSGGGGSIGRSVQFGSTNVVFEKRKGTALIASTYNTNTLSQSSAAILSVASSASLGGVTLDLTHNLAIGVDFVGSATKPDAVALYDITDPASPQFINRYNFPVNQVANANVICQTIISGGRGWSLDANNGLIAFNIVSPQLSIDQAADKVVLSWAGSGLTLQSSPAVEPTSWSDVGTGTLISGRNYVTNNNSGTLYYRLR
jgi:hypothetical protein